MSFLKKNLKSALIGGSIATAGIITVAVLGGGQEPLSQFASDAITTWGQMTGLMNETGNVINNLSATEPLKFFMGIPLLGAMAASGLHAAYTVSKKGLKDSWNALTNKDKEHYRNNDITKEIAKEADNTLRGTNEKIYFVIQNEQINKVSKKIYDDLIEGIKNKADKHYKIVEDPKTGMNILEYNKENKFIGRDTLINGLNKIKDNMELFSVKKMKDAFEPELKGLTA